MLHHQKKRRYYGMLDQEIHKSVTGYMDGLKRDTLTVIERLDMKEFKKSRKVNGMFFLLCPWQDTGSTDEGTELERI